MPKKPTKSDVQRLMRNECEKFGRVKKDSLASRIQRTFDREQHKDLSKQ